MSRCHKKDARAPEAGPEGILPLIDFRGDPWGTGNPNAVAFRAGVLSSPVPAEFAQKMRDEGKAFQKVMITNLDGSPIVRDADGMIRGEPLNITDEQRAALPALGPLSVDEPVTYAYGTTVKRKT